jgi:hypothetical protein
VPQLCLLVVWPADLHHLAARFAVRGGAPLPALRGLPRIRNGGGTSGADAIDARTRRTVRGRRTGVERPDRGGASTGRRRSGPS